jgi:hypothetical protein
LRNRAGRILIGILCTKRNQKNQQDHANRKLFHGNTLDAFG